MLKLNLVLILIGFCTQLAGVNRPIALAQANAVLNRIDLLCEVIICFISFIFALS